MSERIKRTAMGWTVEVGEGWPRLVTIKTHDNYVRLPVDEAEGLLWALQMALNDLKRKEDRANG